MKMDNVVLGASVAVLGFVAYQTIKGRGASAGGGASQAWGPLAGALNSVQTYNDGSSALKYNNAFVSTSWNPFDVSGLIAADTARAMKDAGYSGVNSWGFHL
jgi:hypothetical protein